MKKNISKQNNNSILWWIFGGSTLTTLYFNSQIQDPFNAPKFWIILIIAAWLLGHIAGNISSVSNEQQLKIFGLLLLIFILFSFLSVLKTDVTFTAIFGENQRRNGFLTYLALAIFMFSSALFVRIQSIMKLYLAAFFTGLILASYGLLQISGLDFIEWNNPYNAIISTVGNPNFAAAVLAMLASILFGPVLNNGIRPLFRVSCFLLTIFLLAIIQLSNARQGLIAFSIGISVYLLVWLYSIKNRLRHLMLGGASALGVLAILGMLQIGPLTSLLYKSSVTVRGYYWRAGVEMLKDQLIFGVGIDRYGAYFKQFREVGYPLNYGFNITSSNAHNVPIQIFATAGIFTGLAYLGILGFILWRGVVGIRSTQGKDRLLVASIFSAWLAYIAQSFVSIDNIGISIWGWVLGGCVVGLSLKNYDGDLKSSNESKSKKLSQNKVSFNFKQVFVSSAVTLFAIITVIPLYQAEKNMYETRMRFNPATPEIKSQFYDYAAKTLKNELLEPAYKLNTGSYLAAMGFIDEGLKVLTEVIEKDPRNLDALNLLAEYFQQLGNLNAANKYREQISRFDPYNAANYLQLGLNYKNEGDFKRMEEVRTIIVSFASNTDEGKRANIELRQ